MAVRSYDVGDLVRLRGRFYANRTEVRTAVAAGDTTVNVRDATGYANGEPIIVNPGGDTEETRTVSGSPSGTTITVTAAFTYGHGIGEEVGELTNPTVASLKVQEPDGTETTYTPTQESTGIYSRTVSLDAAGYWVYRFSGTGTVETAEEHRLLVRPSEF